MPDTPPPSTPEPRVERKMDTAESRAYWESLEGIAASSEPPAAPAEGETAEGLSARLPRYRVDGRYGGAIQCYRSDTGEWVRFSDVEQAETFALAASREAQARQAEQIAKLRAVLEAVYFDRWFDVGETEESARAAAERSVDAILGRTAHD